MSPPALSPDVQAELAKGRDPIYFAERILGVRLNRAQKRWFPLVTTDESAAVEQSAPQFPNREVEGV